jgi:hypothetical protein
MKQKSQVPGLLDYRDAVILILVYTLISRGSVRWLLKPHPLYETTDLSACRQTGRGVSQEFRIEKGV